MIYLDNSATTQVSKEAREAAVYCMDAEYFNSSSAYRPAVMVERRINEVRMQIAKACGALPDEIFFTSGGTESNNIAILGSAALMKPGVKLITTTYEHPSVHGVFEALEKSGKQVVRIRVDSEGRLDMDMLQAELTPNVALVSIMQVNNEVGCIQDLNAIAALIRKRSPQAYFHSDGVQAFAKLPFAPLPLDMYSISGHKFHAPKGVGALVMKQHVHNAGGLIGGGQEKGVRSGTLNSSGIIAMGAALPRELAVHANATKMTECKKRLHDNLKNMPDTFVNGPQVDAGAPHILNISFMGVAGETLLHALEEKGVLVSTGSACSAKKQGKNRILESLGLPDERIASAIRFTLSRFNTMSEMDIAAQAIYDCVTKLRKYKRR